MPPTPPAPSADATEAAAPPRPRRSIFADYRAMVDELVEYRELLRSIVARDLVVRYKQTLLGFAWAIFVPVVSMLVFNVVFTHVAPLETEFPYPVYAYAGLLPWTFFTSSLQSATASLTANMGLVTKVYFPREVFPLSAVAVGLVDFFVASGVLIGLMVYYGIGFSWTVLLTPIVILVQIAFTLGLGLVLSVGNLFFRDVRYLVTVLVGIWMFATSVVYPVERFQGRFSGLLRLNPMTHVIEAYRSALLRGEPPVEPAFVVTGVLSVLFLGWAWLFFHRIEPRLAENV